MACEKTTSEATFFTNEFDSFILSIRNLFRKPSNENNFYCDDSVLIDIRFLFDINNSAIIDMINELSFFFWEDPTLYEHTATSYQVGQFVNLFWEELSPLEQEDLLTIRTVYYYPQGIKKLVSNTNNEGHYIAYQKDHLLFRYQLRKILNGGSYGRVFKAYDFRFNKEVAIKIAKKAIQPKEVAYSESRKFLKLGLAEGHQSVGSEYVAKMFHSFEFREHVCLAFELLGVDLSVVIDNNPTGLNLSAVKSITRCILSGLMFLDTNHVVHADLKPNNIAMVPGDQLKCKIIDLGLALYKKETRFHKNVQTIPYRAPEVFLDGQYSTPIDIFSLGIIVALMITGKRSFRGSTPQKLMYKYVEVLGMPPDVLLKLCKNTAAFFSRNPRGYKMVSIEGYEECKPNSVSLQTLIKYSNEPDLISFLEICLAMDPLERFNAAELLNHPWLTS